MTPLWVAPLSALVGFLIGLIPPWLLRRRMRSGHWRALVVEMTIARDFAQVYLNARIGSPLYRLPTKSYSTAFPALLSDGGVTADEVRVVTMIFNEAETLNRGLDAAHAARDEANSKKFEQEVARNRIKAENIVNNLYPDAMRYLGKRRVFLPSEAAFPDPQD